MVAHALFDEIAARLAAGDHAVVHGGFDLGGPVRLRLLGSGLRAVRIDLDRVGIGSLQQICYTALVEAGEDLGDGAPEGWAVDSGDLMPAYPVYLGYGSDEPTRLFGGLSALADGRRLAVVVTDARIPNCLTGTPFARGVPGPWSRVTDLDPAAVLAAALRRAADVPDIDELTVTSIEAACRAATSDPNSNLRFCLVTDEGRFLGTRSAP